MPRHIRKGDTVMLTSGSSKGQIGEILRVLTKSDEVIVKGVNLQTKHIKPNQINPQGGVITKEMPVHISKVSPVVDGKAVRVGFRLEADGTKVRVARHGGKELKVLSVVHRPREGRNAAAPAAGAAPKASKAVKSAAPKPAAKPKAEKAPKAKAPKAEGKAKASKK